MTKHQTFYRATTILLVTLIVTMHTLAHAREEAVQAFQDDLLLVLVSYDSNQYQSIYEGNYLSEHASHAA